MKSLDIRTNTRNCRLKTIIYLLCRRLSSSNNVLISLTENRKKHPDNKKIVVAIFMHVCLVAIYLVAIFIHVVAIFYLVAILIA